VYKLEEEIKGKVCDWKSVNRHLKSIAHAHTPAACPYGKQAVLIASSCAVTDGSLLYWTLAPVLSISGNQTNGRLSEVRAWYNSALHEVWNCPDSAQDAGIEQPIEKPHPDHSMAGRGEAGGT
jgi:hypothetical protein